MQFVAWEWASVLIKTVFNAHFDLKISICVHNLLQDLVWNVFLSQIFDNNSISEDVRG